MRAAILFLCLFINCQARAQDLSIGLKGGYCRYLAIDKTPFYGLTPKDGYSGRLCGEGSLRLEGNKFITEFSFTTLSNKYDTKLQSDHGFFPYSSVQRLFLTTTSFQKKVICPYFEKIYGYVGPSFSLGIATIDESTNSEATHGMAVAPGISQGIVYKTGKHLSIITSLDFRYFLFYQEALEDLGLAQKRNALLMGQIGLFYSL